LAPIPADILDQLVREGPLTAAEVETDTRRFKKALIERADWETRAALHGVRR
jgi:hypothetical protein